MDLDAIWSLLQLARDWQTLLAGLLALGGALITVRAIRKQIRLQETEIKHQEKKPKEHRKPNFGQPALGCPMLWPLSQTSAKKLCR